MSNWSEVAVVVDSEAHDSLSQMAENSHDLRTLLASADDVRKVESEGEEYFLYHFDNLDWDEATSTGVATFVALLERAGDAHYVSLVINHVGDADFNGDLGHDPFHLYLKASYESIGEPLTK